MTQATEGMGKVFLPGVGNRIFDVKSSLLQGYHVLLTPFQNVVTELDELCSGLGSNTSGLLL